MIGLAGEDPGIVFFEPVPKQYFSRTGWNRRLTTCGERYEMLRDKGISSIITLPFDRVTAETSPEEFSGILAGAGPFDGFVVGYDFRYGKGARGTPDILETHLARRGLTLRIAEPHEIGSVPVKSGRIRRLVEQGDLKGASVLLGRDYSALGVVSRGRGLGGELGFPTMNVRVPASKLLPPRGSYAVLADHGTGPMKAAAFVVPDRCLVEVHVPGQVSDLYGAAVNVRFVSFVREPEELRTRQDLKRKIKKDLETAMEVLKEWQ